MTVNPFSLEDDRSKGGPRKSGFPRMQIQSSSSRFYVKTTRSGGGRRYFREAFSSTADYTKPVIKSKFIYRGPDSTRHLIHHVDYMMKSKIDREREPEIRKLFDREGNEIAREEGIHKAVSNQTRELAGHKLILSPGDNNVDLVEYTRAQMKVLEDRFNARIEYSFSFQKNTDHYHSHVTLPASAERRLDFSSDETAGRVDIHLTREDFEAMRVAASRYMRDYNFVDHLTDKRVSEDLLHDWFGEERNKESNYNRHMRKDLGLEMTAADVRALKELGIDMESVLRERGIVVPIKNNQPQIQKEKQEPYVDKEGVVKDELARYLLDRSADFDSSWSDRDISRILQTSERDSEWVFPSAYKKHSKERFEQAEVIQSLTNDSRFGEFSEKLQLHLDLRHAEQRADALKSGNIKNQYVSNTERIKQFFSEEKVNVIFEKLVETKDSLNSIDDRDSDKFLELDLLLDKHLRAESERISEKFGLKISIEPDVEPVRLIEDATIDLNEQTRSLKKMMRVMNYKSFGNFVDSFERLVELKEGNDAIPKYQSIDERNYFLAERLNQPQYHEEREYFGLLQERSFQTYSRFSTGDSPESTKEAIRDSQFALDSKIFELDQKRFEEDDTRKVGFYERSAEERAQNYRDALEAGDSELAFKEARRYHSSVMKFDDERRTDEYALEVNYDRKFRSEPDALAGDFRQAGDLTREAEEHQIDEPGGPSLPLPGYGLERLERDPGDSMSDPTDIRIELTSDELRRRYRDDDEESGPVRQP